jgi:hypothetical protein
LWRLVWCCATKRQIIHREFRTLAVIGRTHAAADLRAALMKAQTGGLLLLLLSNIRPKYRNIHNPGDGFSIAWITDFS